MTFSIDLERQAMKNEPMPRGIDVADSCAYEALRCLYLMYHAGMINRERAREEKQTVLYNWTTAKSKLIALDRDNEALREKIGEAAEAYRANRTTEAADGLYMALFNRPVDAGAP